MSTRLNIPNQQSFNNLGAIGAGHKLYTYETGTTTPKTTFSDTALSVANTNPIIADSAGRFGNIFVSDLSQYKIILKDENDNTLYESDPVDLKAFTLADFDPQPLGYLGTTTGTSTAYLLNPSIDINSYTNKLIFALDFHTACGADATINIYDASDNLIGSKNLKVIVDGAKTNVRANDISASRYILSYDGSDFVILNRDIFGATTTQKGLSILNKPITIANNSSDSEHDIDFSAGVINPDDGSKQAVATALTKKLDASWAAGTGQGGLDAGSIAANTWYYCFAIYNPTTSTADFLISASYSSPTLPSGYTKKEYRGAVLTDASSNIRTATYNLNYVHFHTTLTSYNGTATTTRTFKPISTPPIPVIANITATMDSSSATTASAWVTSPIETDKQPVLDETNNSNMEGNLKSRWDSNSISATRITPLIRSNDATVGIRCTSTNPRFKIYTHGFYDLNIKF